MGLVINMSIFKRWPCIWMKTQNLKISSVKKIAVTLGMPMANFYDNIDG